MLIGKQAAPAAEQLADPIRATEGAAEGLNLMNFASDNVYGVHPKILAALAEANGGTAPSYGGDDYTKKAEEMLKEVFGCDLRAFLVTSGTAANGLALSAITPGFGAIFCHAEAHIAVDECNSPELFTGGAKIIGLHGAGRQDHAGAWWRRR